MSFNAGDLLRAVAIGAGATFLMDLWNFALKRVSRHSLTQLLPARPLVPPHGRGRFRHASIAAAEPKPHECSAGWAAHYATGVLFALVFVVVVAPGAWLAQPTLLPALLYGVVTVVFPLFVMQPALGLGMASSRAPRPAQARLKSLGTHIVFGLGLYGSALGLSYIVPTA